MYSITCIHCSARTETLPAPVTVGICSMLMGSFCDAGSVVDHFGKTGGRDGEHHGGECCGGGDGSFPFLVDFWVSSPSFYVWDLNSAHLTHFLIQNSFAPSFSVSFLIYISSLLVFIWVREKM